MKWGNYFFLMGEILITGFDAVSLWMSYLFPFAMQNGGKGCFEGEKAVGNAFSCSSARGQEGEGLVGLIP
jgi:hypothetical protein